LRQTAWADRTWTQRSKWSLGGCLMAFAMNEVSSFGVHHIVLLPFKIKMYVVRIKPLTMHARPSRTVSTAKSLKITQRLHSSFNL
jgi:hypothetical protein